MEKTVYNNNNEKDYQISILAYKNRITSLSSYFNKNLFISGDKDGKVLIWDLRTSKPARYFNSGIKSKIMYFFS